MAKRIISLIALSVMLLAAFAVLGPIIFWFVLPIALPLYFLILISAKENRPTPTTPSFTPRHSLRLGDGLWKDMKTHVREAIEFSIELLTWARLLITLIIVFIAIAFVFFVPYGPFILFVGLFFGIGIIQFASRD